MGTKRPYRLYVGSYRLVGNLVLWGTYSTFDKAYGAAEDHNPCFIGWPMYLIEGPEENRSFMREHGSAGDALVPLMRDA